MAKVLEAYGFGPNFIGIVGTLYSNLKASILVNGFRSELIDLNTGVKQGDALSCALFILCIDPLIRKIYNSDDIEGLTVRSPYSLQETTVKLFGYADDINPILRNIPSLVNLINIYAQFSEISGIYLNSEKTEIVHLNAPFNPGTTVHVPLLGSLALKKNIKICGIYFPTDDPESYRQNITQKITALKQQLNAWKTRSLTLLGKNILIKAFGISQLTHSFQTCHVVQGDLKEIETTLFQFLWGSRCDKIRRLFLYLPHNQGGIGAIDIHSYYNSIKIRRFLRYNNTNYTASILLDRILFRAGFLSPLIFDVSKKYIQKITNESIKQSINSLSYLNNKISDIFSDIENSKYDHHRLAITAKLSDYPLFNSPLLARLPNLKDIAALLSRLGVFSIATLLTLKYQQPDCDPCFVVSTAFSCLPPKWVVNYNNFCRPTSGNHSAFSNTWGITNYGAILPFQQNNTKKSNLSFLLTNWHRKTMPLDKDWVLAKHHFMAHHDISISDRPFSIPSYFTQYQRAFQFKILHRGITTRAKLALFKIITEDEALCPHCQEGVDDFYHGLIKCPGARSTWASLSTILKEQDIKLALNVGHVLFGVDKKHPYHLPLNLTILKIKQLLLHSTESRRFFNPSNINEVIFNELQIYRQRLTQYGHDAQNIEHLLQGFTPKVI